METHTKTNWAPVAFAGLIILVVVGAVAWLQINLGAINAIILVGIGVGMTIGIGAWIGGARANQKAVMAGAELAKEAHSGGSYAVVDGLQQTAKPLVEAVKIERIKTQGDTQLAVMNRRQEINDAKEILRAAQAELKQEDQEAATAGRSWDQNPGASYSQSTGRSGAVHYD